MIAAEIYLARIALVNRVARMGTYDYTSPTEATVGQLWEFRRAQLYVLRQLRGS